MKISPPSAWHPAPVSAPVDIRWWLLNRDSLTRLIQARCDHFWVEPVFQALATVCIDELEVMSLRRQVHALVREVYLRCDESPVIFAHSVVKKEDLKRSWRGLGHLGNQSLGTMLFTNPMIRRTPFAYKKLKSHHPLFGRACETLQIRPASLWARRSIFTLRGQPILVTEVFLPEIKKLRIHE